MPLRDKPPGWVSPYNPGHSDPKVCTTIDLLEEWFVAMEDGTVVHRLPDEHYQRRAGKPSWTEEELDLLVTAIDREFDRELGWSGRNIQMRCTAGPGFSRLAPPQRLALAQALDATLAQFDTPEGA